MTPFPNNPDNNLNGNNGSGNNGLSKSVLEYVFIAVVIFILICIILRRYRIHKLRKQHGAWGYRNFPPPVELQPVHPDGLPHPPYPDQYLRGIPAAYMGQTRPTRRTRATDIDTSGRRLADIPVEMDHDGELGAKDELPAYDNVGGPPRYVEFDMQNRNQAPLGSIAHTPNIGFENTNNALPENVDTHTPAATTHTVQVSQPENNTLRPIPPYSENSPASMTRRET